MVRDVSTRELAWTVVAERAFAEERSASEGAGLVDETSIVVAEERTDALGQDGKLPSLREAPTRPDRSHHHVELELRDVGLTPRDPEAAARRARVARKPKE